MFNLVSKVLIGCLILLISCSKAASDYEAEELDDLYKNCVEGVLEDDLWLARDCYDAGHFLMMPMHYAFKIKNGSYIDYFKKHFMRFYSLYPINEFKNQSYLNRIQYLYLCSWFCSLCVDNGFVDSDLYNLIDLLEKEVSHMYNTYPGNWAVLGFTCMKDNLEFILNKLNHREKYYSALTDNNIYTLATLSNIIYVKRKLNQSVVHFSDSEIENEIYNLFTSEVTWNKEGGWVLQEGVWSDHPDYYYAGCEDKVPIKEIVSDIGEDVSHFRRMPLWIKSFLLGTNTLEYKRYYDSLFNGLVIQLDTYVIISPSESVPYYRLNNFMSGHNGWFRYDETSGRGWGPFELSSTIISGYYGFLGYKSLYKYTLDHYPFDKIGEKVYQDPVTTRERNPIFISESYRRLLLLLNYKISE